MEDGESSKEFADGLVGYIWDPPQFRILEGCSALLLWNPYEGEIIDIIYTGSEEGTVGFLLWASTVLKLDAKVIRESKPFLDRVVQHIQDKQLGPFGEIVFSRWDNPDGGSVWLIWSTNKDNFFYDIYKSENIEDHVMEFIKWASHITQTPIKKLSVSETFWKLLYPEKTDQFDQGVRSAIEELHRLEAYALSISGQELSSNQGEEKEIIKPEKVNQYDISPKRHANYQKWVVVWREVKEYYLRHGWQPGEIQEELIKHKRQGKYRGWIPSLDTLRDIIRAGEAGELETS